MGPFNPIVTALMLRLNPLSTSKSRTPSMMNQTIYSSNSSSSESGTYTTIQNIQNQKIWLGPITCALRGLYAKLIGIIQNAKNEAK